MEAKIVWFIFVCALPSIYEAYTDRFGESKQAKLTDSLILIIVALVLIIAGMLLLDLKPLKVAALLIGWRLLLFDPLVNWFLKHNSEGHKNINIWTYIGTTSKIDRLVSKVNPWVRLIVRVVLFAAALAWFLVSPS